MSDVRIMTIDPGGTNGVLTAVIPRAESMLFQFLRTTMKVGHVACPDENWCVMQLWNMIRDYRPDVLLMEDFVLFRVDTGDRVGTIPMRLLARLDLLWYLNEEQELPEMLTVRAGGCIPIVEVVLQMPGERSVVSDADLRDSKLWRTQSQLDFGSELKGDHAMQALKHTIVWARKHYKNGTWPI